ncbi:hypothetical protein B0O99DRAFT_683779 [Bisporella sp. PMI_857]|nr:hypothetical protein B0O99DRAFT_683779 [Bisporella sp. PMI_857]
MGNSSSRESRGPDSPTSRRPDSAGTPNESTPSAERQTVYTSRSGRGSRHDLSFLGIGSSSNNGAEVPERRETKQEREARKLEKERVARVKERERSIKEEHVDGGYLVTMGVYTGTEDFSKPVVRQLMIERRIAPFWRGLDDFKTDWTEHQLVAAGRGLPIPAPDEIPPEDFLRPASPEATNSQSNIHNLTVPITSRSQSASSDRSASLSPSHPAFSNASSTPTSPIHSHSPFRPRSKTLASLTTSSKNPSSNEMVPREIQLPKDPYVNGQALEVFLYKDAMECPICFLNYPPYLNKTRCCDQPICSECFVQIKRPDPHPPEHEHNDPSNPNPQPADTLVEAESLVSEPAQCPYCQQAEFGVTYEPPPFRRGMSYANNSASLGTFASAMSSSSSINETSSQNLAPQKHKRRTTSISANASTVITTDRVRPDWATKLAAARSHLARRSAAATALHTAAYLMGNNNAETRGFGFSSRSRFGRHRGENSPGASGSTTPLPSGTEPSVRSVSEQMHQLRREGQDSGSSRQRNRVAELEEMMMLEAIRQSIAAEDERRRKSEKEAAKEAKKKAKEEKKKEKRDRKGVYGSGSSSANGSASAIALALPGIGLGRRRGNSVGSTLAKEVTPESVETTTSKGKEVDRSTTGLSNTSSLPMPIVGNSSRSYAGIPGARHLDTATLTSIPDPNQPSASPTAPDRPSHLRKMSTASSPSSSFVESVPGSLRNGIHTHGYSSSLDTPNASGTNLDAHTGGTPEGGDENGNAGPESMFNFQSLAAMIGHDDEDKGDAAKHIEHRDSNADSSGSGKPAGDDVEASVATLRVEEPNTQDTEEKRTTTLLQPQHSLTPQVMLTAVTPGLNDHEEDSGKQLGSGWTEEYTRQVTQ